MSRTIGLNNALAVFVREAYDVLSCDGELTLDRLLSLAGSLAGKASQFESLSVKKQHELIVEAVERALVLLSSSAEEEHVQKLKKYVLETLPILLNGFVYASEQKKVNSFWSRIGSEVLDVWRHVTSSTSVKKCAEISEKEVSQPPVMLEMKEQGVALEVVEGTPLGTPLGVPLESIVETAKVTVQESHLLQQPQQEEKSPRPSVQLSTTNS